jgi:predicted Zn-dependent protease
MDNNQQQKAIDQLTPLTTEFNELWAFWNPIAQAWNHIGDTANEAYAMSRAYTSIGSLKLAKIQIDRAKKSVNHDQQSQLEKNIDSLSSWLTLQEKLRKEL